MPNPLVKPYHLKLKTDMWAGPNSRAFVIGGGPSAKTFPWDRLEHEKVVGINKAFTLPYCDIVVGTDKRFWKWNENDPRLTEHPNVVTLDGKSGWQANFEVTRVPVKGMPWWGHSFEDGGVGAGPDSGYRALNFTDILGPETIYLIGYDYQGGDDGKQEWWHEPHICRQGNHVYTRYMKAMDIGRKLGRIRAKVINLNPNSAYEGFERVHWSEALGW